MTPEERSIKRKEYNDRYKAKNKQRILEYNREYRKIHKERDREKKALRMVRSRAEKKQKAVDYMGNKCLDCQQNFPNCCYDFHHLDPTKKDLSLSQLVGSRSWEKILIELEKCVMLCSNCHRIRHWKENLEKRRVSQLETVGFFVCLQRSRLSVRCSASTILYSVHTAPHPSTNSVSYLICIVKNYFSKFFR